MSDTNMALWDKLAETDPNRTKKITGKKYKGDSINPNYIYEKLTKEFGPCGIGWGFEVQQQDWKTGLNGEIAHSVLIGLWYKVDGEKSELIPGFGGTIFTGEYSSGLYTDDDATKKSLTDALTKASQLIGMSADIFGGLWDDSKYVADLKEKYKANGDPTQNPNGSSSPEKKFDTQGSRLITEKQVGLINRKFKDSNFTEEERDKWLKKYYIVESTEKLPFSAVNEIMALYNSKSLSPLDLQDDIPIE